MASGIACRLYRANLRRIVMLELPDPVAVRREVSFCEAVNDGTKTVGSVEAVRVQDLDGVNAAWRSGRIAVLVDPKWETVRSIRPDVLVDAIIAKRNLGTGIDDAPVVIGLGPGFTAGLDVHFVVETNRGHNLGKVILSGSAEPNTGIPESVGGYSRERVLRAPAFGTFRSIRKIGDQVRGNDLIGDVEGCEVYSRIDGVIRGLIRTGTLVKEGLKIGDIDPRCRVEYCYTTSEKSRAIAGSVLETIMRVYNNSNNGK
jgi:xanthine dehydrogenase accessory factor